MLSFVVYYTHSEICFAKGIETRKCKTNVVNPRREPVSINQ